MRKEILICDFCQKELSGGNWATGRLWELKIQSNTSSQNGMAGLSDNCGHQSAQYESELCSDCAQQMSRDLAVLILKMKKPKLTPTCIQTK